jgi:hypothetical protein
MGIVRKNLPLLTSKTQYPRKRHVWLLLILLPILIYIISIKRVTWQAEDVETLQLKQFKHLIANLEVSFYPTKYFFKISIKNAPYLTLS